MYTKKFFDPFARRDRLILRINPDKETLSTTVGQLNFMKWMLQRNVHLKVQELKKTTELDMREYDGKEASESASQNKFIVYNGPFRIIF